MGYFFGGLAKLSVKIIILPYLYLVYLYGLYLAYLINTGLAIYLLLLLKLTGFDPAISEIDETDDEEDFQDAVSNIETEDVVRYLTE